MHVHHRQIFNTVLLVLPPRTTSYLMIDDDEYTLEHVSIRGVRSMKNIRTYYLFSHDKMLEKIIKALINQH